MVPMGKMLMPRSIALNLPAPHILRPCSSSKTFAVDFSSRVERPLTITSSGPYDYKHGCLLDRTGLDVTLHGSDHGKGSTELFVDHESENSEHGGTSVVQFDGTLGQLGLLVKVVPSKVQRSVAEVADELVSGALNVLHDTEFQGGNKGNDLGQTGSGNGVGAGDGGPAVGEAIEGVSGLVDGSTEVDSVPGGDLSEEGEHTNAAVLDLDVSQAVELFLVAVFDESERIEVSERGLGSEDVFKGGQRSGTGGSTLLLGGSKGGRGGG